MGLLMIAQRSSLVYCAFAGSPCVVFDIVKDETLLVLGDGGAILRHIYVSRTFQQVLSFVRTLSQIQHLDCPLGCYLCS